MRCTRVRNRCALAVEVPEPCAKTMRSTDASAEGRELNKSPTRSGDKPLAPRFFPNGYSGFGRTAPRMSMLTVKPPSVKVSAMALEALANAAAPKGAANRHVFLFILRLLTSVIATLIKHHI